MTRVFPSVSKLFKSRNFFIQALRYCLVGGIVYLVDIGLFLFLLRYFSDSPYIVNIVAKVGGAITGFLLHRHFTFFGVQKNTLAGQGARYSTLLIFNILFANVIMYSAVLWIHIDVEWAKIASDVIIISLSFLVSRLLVFK